MVINKIMFTSPEAMVEFSRRKNKTSALLKNPLRFISEHTVCKFIFI